MFLRQAHPGEKRHAYQSYDEKLGGAREYEALEAIPWPVLVDDLDGTVHRRYSQEMADPVFLLDRDMKVAFYGLWTHVPTLDVAIGELLARGARGWWPEASTAPRTCWRRSSTATEALVGVGDEASWSTTSAAWVPAA